MARFLPRSLRSRITASVALLVMTVVALAGLVVVLRIDHRDRTDVDRQLAVQAQKAQQDAEKLLTPNAGTGQGINDDYGGLLAGSQSLVRLVSDGRITAQRGGTPGVELPVPTADGYSTVDAGGQSWRSLVEPLGSGGDRLQVLQDLDPIEQRLTDNAQLVTVVALLATLLAGTGVWLLTRLILQPLDRLRAGAQRIRPGDTEQRLPAADGPREVAELTEALNRMLRQLQTSMDATRRFTADAGHELRTPLTSIGMNLETLRRNPDLDPERRRQALAAMAAEHERITALLTGLQALARGDAGALPAGAGVDLAELLAEAVRQARLRHQGTGYRLAGTDTPQVTGWPTGLRLAIDNLLDNAALHGRQDGQVEVGLTVGDGLARVTVSDDGPGIPADLRAAMKQRFTRGARPRSGGSGLGLALVEQQARLHGGSLRLEQAVGGGLRAVVTLPTAQGD
ncbi:ATP-binding protein [Streptacidiphilus sp. N1-3]|uniref:histidine kinase n=1 Tax=Streptacidiphilus alkalitolerans TaxID=3342712 RepID=A0ABV6X3N0_9ACTN